MQPSYTILNILLLMRNPDGPLPSVGERQADRCCPHRTLRCLLPEAFFRRGVTMLGGDSVTSPDELLDTIAEGGSGYLFLDRGEDDHPPVVHPATKEITGRPVGVASYLAPPAGAGTYSRS